MELYGGIDLHSNNCVLVLLDEEDRTVLEKRLQSTRTWPYNTEMLRTFVLTVLTPIAVGMSKVAGVLLTSGRP